MGKIFSKAFDRLKAKKDYKILMVGLDAAGKTTILYKLKLGDVVTTIPTIGFNVETVQYKHISFNVWDIGGQDKIRPLWRHYYPEAHGVIFVVDSADHDRIGDAKKELQSMLADEHLKNTSCLVLANKQDLPHALGKEDLIDKLSMKTVKESIHWHVALCTATTGDGIYEGLDWLSKDISKRPEKKDEDTDDED